MANFLESIPPISAAMQWPVLPTGCDISGDEVPTEFSGYQYWKVPIEDLVQPVPSRAYDGDETLPDFNSYQFWKVEVEPVPSPAYGSAEAGYIPEAVQTGHSTSPVSGEVELADIAVQNTVQTGAEADTAGVAGNEHRPSSVGQVLTGRPSARHQARGLLPVPGTAAPIRPQRDPATDWIVGWYDLHNLGFTSRDIEMIYEASSVPKVCLTWKLARI